MASTNSIRSSLEANFDRTIKKVDDLALNMDSHSPDDMYAFVAAIKDNATAVWAVNEEFRLKHSLAKAIIDEIR